MEARISRNSPPIMLYFFNKKIRNMVEGIFINSKGLDKVKELINKKSCVVLMPIYRSVLDIKILLYCLLVNNIELPFTIGNFEDVPTDKLYETLLKKIGYIKTKRG